jgi:hypothetical protein
MAQVTFTYKNGKKRRIPERDAKILEKLGKGSICFVSENKPAPVQTEVPATPISESVPVAGVAEAVEAPSEITTPSADGLDEMDRDQVLQFAKELGIRIHGGTGVEKAREIIREHTK